MNRWWRAQDSAVDDPKLALLSDKQHRAWFNLCCINSQNGGTLPAIAAIAFKLRVAPAKAKVMVAELAALGLVDFAEDGTSTSTMHNWSKWQYKTDVTDTTNAARQDRYRKRHVQPLRNGESNGDEAVTAKRPESEDRTESEQKDSSLRSEARKRATRLANDWMPSLDDLTYAQSKGLSQHEINIEAEKFRNHWTAKSGRDAAKLKWDSTWQNWILRAIEQGKGRGNGYDRRHGESLGDLGRRLADEAREIELEFAKGIGRPDDVVGGH